MPDDILTPTGESGAYDYTKSKGRSNPFDMEEGTASSYAPLGTPVEVEDIADMPTKPSE